MSHIFHCLFMFLFVYDSFSFPLSFLSLIYTGCASNDILVQRLQDAKMLLNYELKE